MIQVTLDIFSGRENPKGVMDDDQAVGFLNTVAEDPSVIAEVESGFQGLGYRGILIESLDDFSFQEFGFPDRFKIANGASENTDRSTEIAFDLINDFRNFRPVSQFGPPAELDPQIEDYLHSAVPEVRTITEVGSQQGPLAPTSQPCDYETSQFNSNYWNQYWVVYSNNCYNYASNKRTDTFAQPGRGTGQVYTMIDCGDVSAAAVRDGCSDFNSCLVDSEVERWLMALAVSPNYDYHWYRQHDDGFWGHKIGGGFAQNIDNSGLVIMDPETCDRGKYTEFCGFFYAGRTLRTRIF